MARDTLLVDFGGVLTTNVFDAFADFCRAEGLAPDSVRDRATELSGTSLPYVAGCSDLSRRVPVNRVDELLPWNWAPMGTVKVRAA